LGRARKKLVLLHDGAVFAVCQVQRSPSAAQGVAPRHFTVAAMHDAAAGCRGPRGNEHSDRCAAPPADEVSCTQKGERQGPVLIHLWSSWCCQAAPNSMRARFSQNRWPRCMPLRRFKTFSARRSSAGLEHRLRLWGSGCSNPSERDIRFSFQGELQLRCGARLGWFGRAEAIDLAPA